MASAAPGAHSLPGLRESSGRVERDSWRLAGRARSRATMSRQSKSMPESCEDADVRRDTGADADADSEAALASTAAVPAASVARSHACTRCRHQHKRKKRRDLLQQQLKLLSAKRQHRSNTMYRELLPLRQPAGAEPEPAPCNPPHSEFSTDNELADVRSRRKKKK